MQPEQAARYEADPWEDQIKTYVGGRDRVSVTEVARGALPGRAKRLRRPTCGCAPWTRALFPNHGRVLNLSPSTQSAAVLLFEANWAA